MNNRICVYCNAPLVEIGRSAERVFYKCDCHLHKGVEWDWSTALLDGVEYELGSAGSFVHDCPKCKATTLRVNVSNEVCLVCGKARVELRKVGK